MAARFKVYNHGEFIGETVAESAAHACSLVRFRRFGLVKQSTLDLSACAVPMSGIVVDVEDVPRSPSAVRLYPGIRVRRRGFLGR